MSGPTLWNGVRAAVCYGWLVVLVRLVLDGVAPDRAWTVGIFFLMPVALLVIGRKGGLDAWSWKRLATGMILIGVLCWGLGNLLSYGTAATLGWDHGRFNPDGPGPPFGTGPPLPRDTLLQKLGWIGLPAGAGAIAGSLWCILWGSLLIYLPGRARRRRAAASS